MLFKIVLLTRAMFCFEVIENLRASILEVTVKMLKE